MEDLVRICSTWQRKTPACFLSVGWCWHSLSPPSPRRRCRPPSCTEEMNYWRGIHQGSDTGVTAKEIKSYQLLFIETKKLKSSNILTFINHCLLVKIEQLNPTNWMKLDQIIAEGRRSIEFETVSQIITVLWLWKSHTILTTVNNV